MAVPLPAAGNGPGPKGAELLERCGSCRERLSPEREPRLLPCLHSVCRACLRTAPGAGNAFECPVCQQQCPLGDIMDNLFLQDSGAGPAPGQPDHQSCTSCQDNAAATAFCLECAEPLCDTCVEAHLRVRYTRQHSVRALDRAVPLSSVPGPCRAHPAEPLALFCSSCATLTCRQCHLSTHHGHPSQSLDSAVHSQRSALAALLQRLGDKHTALQRGSRDLHGLLRRVTDVQQRVQVEVKMAVLHVMKELNKRAKALLADAQRVTEGRRRDLERRQRALSRARRQQEHILRFGARALQGQHGTALLLTGKMVQSQVLRSLAVTVEPPEPPGELRFHWDRQSWSQSAQSFGAIVTECPLPPSLSPQPAASPISQATAGVSGGQVTPEQLLQGPPPLSPPPLEPRPDQTPGVAPSSPESAGTGARSTEGSPREEKFIKKLLIKRRCPLRPQPPLPPKVPRVSLERLQLDTELDPAQPPLFRIFPGPSADQFSVIVIEQGTAGTAEGTAGVTAQTAGSEGTAGTAQPQPQPQPQPALPVKEEQQESPIGALGDIGDIGDTKPAVLPAPPPVVAVPAVPVAVPVTVPALSPGSVAVPAVPVAVSVSVSCCCVCGQAGAVVMCDRCQRCFHLHCHLPALHDVPSPEWTCRLCQELPPPSADPEPGPTLKLSPLEQQRCEFVLLELLCHEPWRPLQRLTSGTSDGAAIDLTLMRARLQEKLSPPYGSAEEFARDGVRLLRQFHRIAEDKADVQSLLGLQRFLESRLSAAFGDRKFSWLLLDPNESPPETPMETPMETPTGT